MNVEITIIGMGKALNVWTTASASVDGRKYRIEMVRFDEPSVHGIRQGRISKLWMRSADGSETITYDRGWDLRPKTACGKALLAEITKRYN